MHHLPMGSAQSTCAGRKHEQAASEVSEAGASPCDMPVTVLERLLQKGEATTLAELVYLHEDRFRESSRDGNLLENKMVIPHGQRSPELNSLREAAALDSAVPGGCALPRFGVQTVCCAGSVELHQLHGELHGGSSFKGWLAHHSPSASEKQHAQADSHSDSSSEGFSPEGLTTITASSETASKRKRSRLKKKRTKHKRERDHALDSVSNRRGCWQTYTRADGSMDACFYPAGFAVTDWNS